MKKTKKMGIYFIRNTKTGSAYVGSSVNSFNKRWGDHRYMLRNNIHPNRHLQNAWNKYGEESFLFEIAETIENDEMILQREQYWMDVFFDAHKCYNIRPKAESNRGIKWSKESKDLLSDIVKNYMSDSEYYKKWYAARNDPDVNRRISNAAKKRWSNPEFKRKISRIQSYKIWDGFISPEGIEYRNIENLVEFCEDHGVSYVGLRSLVYGNIVSHQGWVLANPIDDNRKARKPYTKEFNFIGLDGEEYKNITNLAEFARTIGVNKTGLQRVHAGKAEQFKGWRKLILEKSL